MLRNHQIISFRICIVTCNFTLGAFMHYMITPKEKKLKIKKGYNYRACSCLCAFFEIIIMQKGWK